jgi:hypothetical protein
VSRDLEDAPSAARHEVLIELTEVSGVSGRTLDDARKDAIDGIRRVSKAEESELVIESMQRCATAHTEGGIARR